MYFGWQKRLERMENLESLFLNATDLINNASSRLYFAMYIERTLSVIIFSGTYTTGNISDTISM
ncbi:hypothetical protein RO3G_01813 [Rhizopus delemar RA 99-880]|uniref:Uncharacterized protein n=1 Tax=Rhizopus delemar (strain RA 99-880 / ATCC MYA-4621 / FGSC 9543 / NRRL 43880) TaxID=246409 RepID=I1BLM9_RHIO9|nr:hypothetical protein RO3G_01813 [Rhizopus delemar RA 99-880]|eukprot:EIE77109.1 hypothetical protein RO3G_01813 [Rhizopus delemar RA 99-880]